MIKSTFIADTVSQLLNSDDNTAIRPQLEFITDTLHGYTSNGLFVTFSHDDAILPYKSPQADLVLKGVKITCVEMGIEAAATLLFKNGLINSLEISCHSGTFPRRDLTEYTLSITPEDGINK